jgi:hypothetical protein
MRERQIVCVRVCVCVCVCVLGRERVESEYCDEKSKCEFCQFE